MDCGKLKQHSRSQIIFCNVRVANTQLPIGYLHQSLMKYCFGLKIILTLSVSKHYKIVGLVRGLTSRSGTGMKSQVGLLVGYRVFKKIQVRVESGSQRSRICVYDNACQIFQRHKIFWHIYHVTSIKSINIVFETGKYHS